GSLGERLRRERLPGVDATSSFLVDEERAVQRAVLAHQILGRGNVLLLLLPFAITRIVRRCRRRRCAGAAGDQEAHSTACDIEDECPASFSSIDHGLPLRAALWGDFARLARSSSTSRSRRSERLSISPT